jgi:hypothetical protein
LKQNKKLFKVRLLSNFENFLAYFEIAIEPLLVLSAPTDTAYPIVGPFLAYTEAVDECDEEGHEPKHQDHNPNIPIKDQR